MILLAKKGADFDQLASCDEHLGLDRERVPEPGFDGPERSSSGFGIFLELFESCEYICHASGSDLGDGIGKDVPKRLL
jgi:hypothetical protein